MNTDYRPHFHFTPPRGWMNDPNGLIFYEGEYHLFYQHLGPRHWGHAVSRDLVTWEHLPIALAPNENGEIWSGSAVVDRKDTSGFFNGGEGMVAVFTSRIRAKNQSQSLAFSADRGRTWTMHANNPVLRSDNNDFRDPQVFWHEASAAWVLLVAAGRRLEFYRSPDLRRWTLASVFEGGAAEKNVWECPDLFPLALDNNGDRRKWVLLASYFGTALTPACRGDQETVYFVGDFDGHTFTPDGNAVFPLSYGMDDYAAVCWSDAPNGRCPIIGWMNRWAYAHEVPTGSWRGAMTLPRDLALRTFPEGVRLVQNPVPELQALRRRPSQWTKLLVAPGDNPLAGLHGEAFEIVAEFEVGAASEWGFRVRVGEEQQTTVGYAVAVSELFIDRRRSGATGFHASFPVRHTAPLAARDGVVRLQIFVDRCSVEVFGNDGEVYLADLIFPDFDSQGIELYARESPVKVKSLTFYPLTEEHQNQRGSTKRYEPPFA